ncbi:MAG: hypothetical protein ACLQEQ_06900 [Nitrososphaerales archaeon]
MVQTGKAIQVLIVASSFLGVALLIEINSVVPSDVFDFVAVGWALFVVDGVLTFVRPVISYYLGLVLAVLALSASLPQSAHWAFIENGLLIPSAIFVTGSAFQVLIIVLVVYYSFKTRRSGEWSWPGAKSAV